MLKERILDLAAEQRGPDIAVALASTSGAPSTELEENLGGPSTEVAGRDSGVLSPDTVRESSPDPLETDFGPDTTTADAEAGVRGDRELHTSEAKDDWAANALSRLKGGPSTDLTATKPPTPVADEVSDDDEIEFIGQTSAVVANKRPAPRPKAKGGNKVISTITGPARRPR